MLKIVEDSDDANYVIEALGTLETLKDYNIGLAGSFASNTNKKSSAVDIVLSLKKGADESSIGSVSILKAIYNYLGSTYANKFCIYWLDLMEKDEDMYLRFAKQYSLEENQFGGYSNIVGGVKWIVTANSQSSDSDNDISIEEEDELEDTHVMTAEESMLNSLKAAGVVLYDDSEEDSEDEGKDVGNTENGVEGNEGGAE